MSRLRSATVEPVLGTLINFMGMKKVYTRGIAQAEKHVLMAALCYNLKKLLKVKPRKVESAAVAIKVQTEIEPKTSKICFYMFFAILRPFSDKISHCFSNIKILTTKSILAGAQGEVWG